LLYTTIPSESYAPKGATLQCLLEVLVEDLNLLYEEGIEALDFPKVPRVKIGTLFCKGLHVVNII